jgi:hypothetical protein
MLTFGKEIGKYNLGSTSLNCETKRYAKILYTKVDLTDYFFPSFYLRPNFLLLEHLQATYLPLVQSHPQLQQRPLQLLD